MVPSIAGRTSRPESPYSGPVSMHGRPANGERGGISTRDLEAHFVRRLLAIAVVLLLQMSSLALALPTGGPTDSTFPPAPSNPRGEDRVGAGSSPAAAP